MVDFVALLELLLMLGEDLLEVAAHGLCDVLYLVVQIVFFGAVVGVPREVPGCDEARLVHFGRLALSYVHDGGAGADAA